jgi:hypothetical protein
VGGDLHCSIGIVLYSGVEAVKFSDDLIAVPIARLWQGGKA